MIEYMAEYIAQRIIDGFYNYQHVIGKKPLLKDGIDTYLIAQGRRNLIITRVFLGVD
jgi:hypothetical protein